MDIPVGWTSKEKNTEQGKMFIVSSDSLFTDSSANMNILIERMPKDDIENYRASTIKSILASMPGTTILDKGDIEAGDLKGNWFTSRMQDSEYKIDAVNYSFPKDGSAYIITGAMGIGQLEKHRGMLDSIAKSFRIKE